MRAVTPIQVALLALVLVCSLSANIGSPTVSQDNHFLGVLLSSTNTTSISAGYNAYDTKPNSGLNSQRSPLSGFDVTVSSGTTPKSANYYVSGSHEFVPERTSATPEPSYLPLATGIMLVLAFLRLRIYRRQSR